ncbi:DUF7701 domain-containing protein [Rhodococcus qingshengii]
MNYIDSVARKIELSLKPEDRPQENAQQLYRLYALLAMSKGSATTLTDVHNAWSIWMLEQEPCHPAIREFSHLEKTKQTEDEPFLEAIKAVSFSIPCEDGSPESRLT